MISLKDNCDLLSITPMTSNPHSDCHRGGLVHQEDETVGLYVCTGFCKTPAGALGPAAALNPAMQRVHRKQVRKMLP